MRIENNKRLKDLSKENPAPQANLLSIGQSDSSPPAMQRMNSYKQRANPKN